MEPSLPPPLQSTPSAKGTCALVATPGLIKRGAGGVRRSNSLLDLKNDGSVNEKRGFDVLWQSPNAPKPVPFSPYG